MIRPLLRMTTAPDEPVILTIGRAQDCDLVVAHRSVSAHHAELRQAGSQYRIVDLSSNSGTFVNGVRSASQILDEGDTVHVGPVALQFRNGRLEIGIQEQPGQGEPTTSDVPATKGKKAPTVRTLAGIGLAIAGLVALLIATGPLNRSGNGDEGPPAAFETTTAPETAATNRTTEVTTTTTTQLPGLAPSTSVQSGAGEPDWALLARSIVDVWSPDCERGGSGTLVLDGSYVLTNAHVVADIDATGKSCDLFVGFTNWWEEPPDNYVQASTVLIDEDLDLALLQLIDPASGKPMVATQRAPINVQDQGLTLGEEISTLGYPGRGTQTITFTRGDNSGTVNLEKSSGNSHGMFLKTTANMNPGISGGAAFNSQGQFIGVPTGGFGTEVVCEDELCVADGSSLGLIRPSSYAERFLARLP